MTQIYPSRIAVFLCAVALCASAHAAELKQKTTTAFDRYVTATEARFKNELHPGGTFLFVDGLKAEEKSKAYEQLKQGEILVEKLETKTPGVSSDIPDGMV